MSSTLKVKKHPYISFSSQAWIKRCSPSVPSGPRPGARTRWWAPAGLACAARCGAKFCGAMGGALPQPPPATPVCVATMAQTDVPLPTKPEGECKVGALPDVVSAAELPTGKDGGVSFQQSMERLQALRGEAKEGGGKHGRGGVLKRPAARTKPVTRR